MEELCAVVIIGQEKDAVLLVLMQMRYERLDVDGELSAEISVSRLSGRVCTRSWLSRDSLQTVARLAVLATDWATVPRRSAAVGVQLNIIRAADGPAPRDERVYFDTGFYFARVDEDVAVGHCVLSVSTCTV